MNLSYNQSDSKKTPSPTEKSSASSQTGPTNPIHSIRLDTIEIILPDWVNSHSQATNELVLRNPNGYALSVKKVDHGIWDFLIVGNCTYQIIYGDGDSKAVDLRDLNAIGNYMWFKFFNLKYFHITQNYGFHLPFEDAHPGEALRLFPVNPVLYPKLMPKKLSEDILSYIRRKLGQMIGSKSLEEQDSADFKRLEYNFYKMINYLAMVATNGDARDYYDAQDLLSYLRILVDKRQEINLSSHQNGGKTQELIQLIPRLQEHLLLSRTGVNWEKWNRTKKKICGKSETKISNRTKTIFERKAEAARLRIPKSFVAKDRRNEIPENWQVISVEALGEEDIEPLASKEDVKRAREINDPFGGIPSESKESLLRNVDRILKTKERAAVYGFGETLIGNAIMVSLAFAGGSATTVKKIMQKNKLVHLALKVKSSSNRIRWISLLQARAGLILGQHPSSKIVFVTNIEGTVKGESESSTLDFLENEYSQELDHGQIFNVNQRAGLILDPTTGNLLRFKDGSLAIVAENHLWAFFGLLLSKKKVLDILQNTSGIISIGNGDNILNYPRPGMLGEIEFGRRLQGRPIATVAIAALSAGDKKGGFAAKVTYENTQTGAQFEQIELREISEFPSKGGCGFNGIEISENETNFFKTASEKHWFIEDIFRKTDGTDKKVAFNVAFYAVDLRLIIARVFGMDETDRNLTFQLQNINDQDWVDRIVSLGESVPAIEHLNKTVPNEDGSDEVEGYMTEQMVQDFIVNALPLLENPRGLPDPEFVIRLVERKDFFLPYKGKKQYELDEDGNVVIEPVSGKPHELYDLIANQKRYSGIIKDHLQEGQQLVLGPNEFVSEIIPVDLDAVKLVNQQVKGSNKIPFHRKKDSL